MKLPACLLLLTVACGSADAKGEAWWRKTQTAVARTRTAAALTRTPTLTRTATATPTRTATAIPARTSTPTPSATIAPPTATRTLTSTVTPTPTPTPTIPPTPSVTITATAIPATGWSRRYGNTADDRAAGVAVDGQGRVAVTGSFYGATDFGGGTVTSYVHPAMGPTMDVFVAEYAPSGAYLWSRVIGADSDDAGRGVATDAGGNVLVTGYQGSYSVNYGSGAQFNHGGNDLFVAKYSPTGAWVWSKTIGGTGYEQGNAIAATAAGDVYVTGYIGASAAGVDFGGGTLVSAGFFDVFLAKYSSSGVYGWSKRFGGAGNDQGMAIAVAGGDVIVAGSFEGTADFGSGNLTSAGLRDIFVTKYSAAGSPVWVQRFGGMGDDIGLGVAVDTAGDVLLAGKFQGSVLGLTSAGGDDILLTKLAGATGLPVWAKRFGGTSGDQAIGVAVGSGSSILATGYFTGSVDFGGGALAGAGLDVFAAKFSTSGAHLWSKRFGGFDTQIGSSAAALPGGSDIAIAGYFASTIDSGGGVLTSAGSYDAYLVKVATESGGPTVTTVALGGLALIGLAGAGYFIYQRNKSA